jgi:hypothetical protein
MSNKHTKVLVEKLKDWDNLEELRADVAIMIFVGWSKSFRPDIQKPRQIESAVRDI